MIHEHNMSEFLGDVMYGQVSTALYIPKSMRPMITETMKEWIVHF